MGLIPDWLDKVKKTQKKKKSKSCQNVVFTKDMVEFSWSLWDSIFSFKKNTIIL